jgi:hypothetical protein
MRQRKIRLNPTHLRLRQPDQITHDNAASAPPLNQTIIPCASTLTGPEPGSGASDADTAFIQERNETARQSSEAAGNLRAYRANPSTKASGTIYSAKDEFELFKRIDNWIDSGFFMDSWYINYEVVRSEVDKRLYSCDPDQLSSAIRDHLERQWRFYAEQAIIQLGGEPLGESDTLALSSESMVMLFQIPSNDLTHFAHGDTGGLIILISEANLRERRFDLASYDIGH